MISQKIVENVINLLLSRKVTFGELFVEYTTVNSVQLINEKVEKSTYNIISGAGIRVFSGLNAVYSYTNDLDEKNLLKLANEVCDAVKIYGEKRPSIALINKDIERKQKPIIVPLSSHKKDAVDNLRAINIQSKKVGKEITETASAYTSKEQNVLIANTDGLLANDRRYNTNFTAQAIASNNNDKQSAYENIGIQGGFEVFDNIDLQKLGNELGESAKTILFADYIKSGQLPVIIHNKFGGVIFHEACGHALEATSVAKKTSVFTDKIGQKIASDKVSAIDDGTLQGQWGSLNIDDEGEKTRRNVLIENGILKGYLVDKLNGMRMGVPSTGSARRESYKYAPTSRMNNTYILNGNDSVDDMISSIEYGLFAKKMGGGSVQTSTGDFNFSVNEGYVIRNGKICEPVRGATLIGKGQEILHDIEMVGDNFDYAQGMCGSISGSVPTNVGQPTLKVSKITVGGR